jgi:pimeloyl-ACP methyl ester carboxylesterase
MVEWLAAGPIEGPVLLWLHGSTGSRRTSPHSIDARVVAYDRPGYGRSHPHEERDLRSDVDDICALLDGLSINRIPVLAFSGGAAIGYAMAAWAPDRITTLNVVSGATWPTEPCPPFAALQAAGERLRSDPAGVVDGLVANAPALDRRVLRDPTVREQLLVGARDAVAQGPSGWVAEARILRSAWGFSPAAVRCPVRLWHGSLDSAVPFDAAEKTTTALANASLQSIPDAGHFGWMSIQHRVVTAAVSAPTGATQ